MQDKELLIKVYKKALDKIKDGGQLVANINIRAEVPVYDKYGYPYDKIRIYREDMNYYIEYGSIRGKIDEEDFVSLYSATEEKKETLYKEILLAILQDES